MVMATIYAVCGKYNKALDELEELLSYKVSYTVNDLIWNKELDPLREMPRFKELLRKYYVSLN
jgi:hypothetical protein